MAVPVRSALVAEVGARIRALRTARGLTQAGLAAPRYTKAYISMLEAGRTRASMRALEHIAEKLDVRPADLLADGAAPPALGLEAMEAERRARAALRTASAADALRAAERALAAASASGDGTAVARAQVLVGVARSRAGDATGAIRSLREAVAALARGDERDTLLEFRTEVALARARAAAGDAQAALAHYERARGLAAQLEPRALADRYARLSQRARAGGDLGAALRYASASAALDEQSELREEVAAVLAESAALAGRRRRR